MTWTLTTSLTDFQAAAGEFLAAHRVPNTLPLTITHRLAVDGPRAFGSGVPRFGWWQAEPGGPVEGVFVQTPPYGPVLGVLPGAAAGELAGALHAAGGPVPSVVGEKTTPTAFARAWERLTGSAAQVRVYERLHRLAGLTPPDPAPGGRARSATPADHALLVAWSEAFGVESDAARPGVDHDAQVRRRTADGSLLVWEDGGRPVSFAGVSPVVAGMSRIGPVYTPPELRRRGYASALVAAGSAQAIDCGAQEVLLYTDLANPTSNSIYRKLGYRRVADALLLDL